MTASLTRSWRPWLWLGVSFTAAALVPMGSSSESSTLLVSAPLVLALGALAVGLARRGGRDRARYEQALAAAAARDAVLSDRITIARELHDIISHGLGAVTVRASTGHRLGQRDPGAALAALADVVEISRTATEELRRLLSVLSDGSAPAPTAPAPSLQDLPELVEQARRQGLQVETSGLDSTVYRPGVALTAYHVVREALANTTRYAGPTRVEVRLERAGDLLTVLVADAGPASGWAPRPGSGHGLALLASRVRSQSGRLDHGPQGLGYRTCAQLWDPAPHV